MCDLTGITNTKALPIHPLHQAFAEHVPRVLHLDPVARFLGIPQLIGMLQSLRSDPSYTRALQELGASVQVEGLDQVPDGPIVVVPNHAFSLIDALAVGAALEQKRPPGTVRAVADKSSSPLVELHPLLLFVGHQAAGRDAFWQESVAHLGNGGAVIMFPAGHSVMRARDGIALETPWRSGCLKLAARSGSALVPAHVHAPSRRRYQFLRRHFDRKSVQKFNLREAVLYQKAVRIRFGAPLPADTLSANDLRQHVYALGEEPFRT